jgi:DNA invertase Pin-like site-specific DNA recombinase
MSDRLSTGARRRSRPRRVALYARPRAGARSATDLVADLRRKAARRGWRVVQTYLDEERVPARQHLALRRLLDDARKGRFDAVVATHLVDLGTSLAAVADAIEHLHAEGVAFVSMHAGVDIDTSGASGTTQVTMLRLAASVDRALRRERTLEGIERSRMIGTKTGRPVGGRRISIDVESVRARLAAGEAAEDVAAAAGCSPRTLFRRLREAP